MVADLGRRQGNPSSWGIVLDWRRRMLEQLPGGLGGRLGIDIIDFSDVDVFLGIADVPCDEGILVLVGDDGASRLPFDAWLVW